MDYSLSSTRKTMAAHLYGPRAQRTTGERRLAAISHHVLLRCRPVATAPGPDSTATRAPAGAAPLLTPDDHAFWHANGYLVVEGVVSEEVNSTGLQPKLCGCTHCLD
jgi:hypothetical protein